MSLMIFRSCHDEGLSKVAVCQRKLPPTWLVSASYSAWHFFTDGTFLNKISLDWPLTLTTQPSTSNLSDNPDDVTINLLVFKVGGIPLTHC